MTNNNTKINQKNDQDSLGLSNLKSNRRLLHFMSVVLFVILLLAVLFALLNLTGHLPDKNVTVNVNKINKGIDKINVQFNSLNSQVTKLNQQVTQQGGSGQTGSIGQTGSQGTSGPTQTNGTNGANGRAGATGPAGHNGAQGATGPAGAANDVMGIPGSQGLQGDQGNPGSGLAGVGPLDSQSKSLNGAVLTDKLYMQSANGSYPGLMNTTTQTVAGDKTLTGHSTFRTIANSSNGLQIQDSSGNYLMRANTVDYSLTVTDTLPNVPGFSIDSTDASIETLDIDNSGYASQTGHHQVVASDGFSRILWVTNSTQGGNNQQLILTRCLNDSCTDALDTVVWDPNDVPTTIGELDNPSIVMGNDGFPRITFITNYTASPPVTYVLIYIRCLDADCTSTTTNIINNPGGYQDTMIALGQDGFVRIAYDDYPGVSFLRCTNDDCTSPVITDLPDDFFDTSYYSYQIALIVGADGFARMAYSPQIGFSVADLRYLRCTDADCTSPVYNTVDTFGFSAGDEGVRMEIGTDGFPKIAYNTESVSTLRYANCNDDDCSAPTIKTIDTDDEDYYGGFGFDLNSSGLPAFTYDKKTTHLLNYTTCSDVDCSSMDSVVVDSNHTYGGYYGTWLSYDSQDKAHITYSDSDTNSFNYGFHYALITPAILASAGGTNIGTTSQPFGSFDTQNLTTSSSLTTGDVLPIGSNNDIGSISKFFGQAYLQGATFQGDSTSALSVSNLSGNLIMRVDTVNHKIYQNGYEVCDMSGNCGTTATLQDAYNNSGTPATLVANIGNKGVRFTAGIDSTTLFQVQASNGGNLMQFNSVDNQVTLNGQNSGDLTSWASTTSLPSTMYGQSVVTANGYAYTIGGNLNGNFNDSPTIYYGKINSDGTISSWQTNPNPLPVGDDLHASVVANGYVYVVGGFSSSDAGRNTVYYAKLNNDGTTGSWTTSTNPLPVQVESETSVVNNGYIYVIGGEGLSNPGNTVYYAKLNPDGSTSSWTTSPSTLPDTRWWHSSVVVSGYVYVFGGYKRGDPTSPKSTVYYAKLNSDGTVGTWQTNANSLPTTTYGSSAVNANGYVYVVGGCGAGCNSVVYAALNADGSTGAWQTSSNHVPSAQYNTKSIIYNGYIYTLGGLMASYLNNVYFSQSQKIIATGATYSDYITINNNLTSHADTLLQASTNSTTAFAVQDQVGTNLFNVDTLNNITTVGSSFLSKNNTNSTTAFQVQNVAGTSLLTIDTTNTTITLGSASATPVLLVLGNKNTSGDPTGSAGATYYNSNTNHFRCFENSAWHDCNGGTLGSASVTANQTTITTETDLTSLTLTVTVPANHRIRISAQTALQSSVAADQLTLRIKESSTTLQTCASVMVASAIDQALRCYVVLTPTSGSHTYKLSLQRTSGTGNAQLSASSTQPASILVEDIGQ